MFGRRFSDFEVGDIYRHWPGKTITESDNSMFCLISMNHHPVHIDAEYASESHHGKILVVGTYIISLVVGQSVKDVSGQAIANLGYEKIDHVNPVFVGDTIYSKSEVISKRLSKKNSEHGIVQVMTAAWNQHEQRVLEMYRSVLVPV